MRIEEGKTCKVFNRILLALKYLRQLGDKGSQDIHSSASFTFATKCSYFTFCIHTPRPSCLEMIRCLLFLQVTATKAGTSGKVVQFLHTVGVWPCSYGHPGHQGRLKWVPGL